MEFSVIYAVDEKNGIGRDGGLPWYQPEEMKHFKQTTVEAPENKKNAVIMGYKTYLSLGKLLPRRINVVITTAHADEMSKLKLDNLLVFDNFDTALVSLAKSRDNLNLHKIFVIGGATIYKLALAHPALRNIIETLIVGDYKCDVCMPMRNLGNNLEIYRSIPTDLYTINYYHVRNNEEQAYLNLVQRILCCPLQPNRTKTLAHYSFSEKLDFSLTDARGVEKVLPLLTTKKMPVGIIFKELLWFLRGDSDVSYLQSENVGIWDGNSSKAFHEANGHPDWPEGYVGKIYGVQWRNFGGKLDQIAWLINEIKTNPMSRRLVVTAWNPLDIAEQALPPCHILQVYNVEYIGDQPTYLNLHVTMRSADLGLGVPFNIASYALLAHMIAEVVGLKAKKLSISMVNCHVYADHADALKCQIQRTPYLFPTFKFTKNIDRVFIAPSEYTADTIQLTNYICWDSIKMKMMV